MTRIEWLLHASLLLVIILGVIVSAVLRSTSSSTGELTQTARSSATLNLEPACQKSSHQELPDLRGHLAKVPLFFEHRTEQKGRQAHFVTRGAGYGLHLMPQEIVLSLSRPEKRVSKAAHVHNNNSSSSVIRMKWLHSNATQMMQGEGLMSSKSNYFLGNDPSRWKTNLEHFQKIRYHELYPGIDLSIYGNQRNVEYDLIAGPGSRPAEVEMAFEGLTSLSVNKDGDLLLNTAQGQVIQRKPLAYQEMAGVRETVQVNYRLLAENRVAFQLGIYDPRRTLVIDPVLAYSTYFGGTLDEGADGLSVDPQGNVSVIGRTSSTDLTLGGAVQTSMGGTEDVFVLKFNPLASSLIYATYLGGSQADRGFAIASDSMGNAYMTGLTESADFPRINAFQNALHGGQEAFVAKLSPTGSVLAYSSFFGGAGNDQGAGIAVDLFGSAWVTGDTLSNDLPLLNSYQSYNGGQRDAFVTKIGPAGNQILSTYLGGSNQDSGRDIAVDTLGNAYVTGTTNSFNFPTLNPVQAIKNPSNDVFVSKFTPQGTSLMYSTFLGGNQEDIPSGIAIDAAGHAYVSGMTSSSNWPLANAIQSTFHGAFDGFIAAINSTGNTLIYSTYLGGTESDQGMHVRVDDNGNAVIVGTTVSADFPLANPIQSTFSNWDSVVARLGPLGDLLFSSYLGGSSTEEGTSVGVDKAGNLYAAGKTWSTDFPTQNAFQTVNRGYGDAFLSRYRPLSPCASFGFASPSSLLLGTSPTSIEPADLNSDGRLDLVVTLSSRQNALLYSDGNGGFTRTDLPNDALSFDAATADFNGDGKSDLAIANYELNSVTVYFGNGAGGFGNEVSLSTGTNPRAIQVGDFNRDGKPDLAVANRGDFTVGILLADGAGSFIQGNTISVGTLPQSLALIDLNRDGIADLAVANFLGTVTLLQGDGNGGFSSLPSVTVSDNTTSLAAGDFNSDGLVDLAATLYQTGRIAVFSGNGNGGFGPAAVFNTGSAPAHLIISEFNGDGRLDIATANANSSNVSVLLGNGTGGFGTAISFATNTNSDNLAAADMNGDGKTDLISGALGRLYVHSNDCLETPTGSVSPNNLNFGGQPIGTTSPSQTVTLSNTGTGTLGINSISASGDFVIESNGCGSKVFGGVSCQILVAFQPTASGTRNGSVTISHNAAGSPHSVSLSGVGAAPQVSLSSNSLSFSSVPAGSVSFAQTVVVNNTGNAPLLVSSVSITGDFAIHSNGCVFGADPFDSCYIQVRFQPTVAGNRTGSLSIADNAAGSPRSVALSGTGTSAPLLFGNPSSFSSAPFPYNLISADFNGDGKPDLATTAGLSVHFGNGDGSFQAGTSYPPGGDQIAVGDFNVDGWTDMALSSEGSGSASIYLNNQNGTFQPPLHYPVGMPPRALAVADFNNDIYPDLVVASFNCCAHKLTVFLGNGTGSLQTGQDIPLPGSLPTALGVGDFNRDGRRDLVVSNYGSGNVTIFLGNGNGTFQSPQNYGVNSAPNRPNNLVVSDFDRDGKEDLAVSCQDVSGVVSVLRGNGDGTFLPAVTYSTGPNAARLAMGDFNNDAIADLAVSTDQGAAVLLGNGDGSFQSPVLYGIGIGGAVLVAGDFSQDGLHDLAGVKSDDGNIYTLLNNGNGLHSSALAWGYNANGQLGNGTVVSSTTPVRIVGLDTTRTMAAGSDHSLAVRSDGTVWAWGWNGAGQLGNGSTTATTTPIQVTGLSGVTAVAAGANHSLGLRSDGTVWTWGNSTASQSMIPFQVIGLSGVKAIAAGGSHSLAVTFDGTVWAWGNNNVGQLGNGTTTLSMSPVQVANLNAVAAVAAGDGHSMALKIDGTVWTWGHNGSGQLGHGTTADSLTPIQVTGLANVRTIACGQSHSLAAVSDGTVRAWGNNSLGQLGNGTTTNSTTPVQVSSLTTAMAIAGGRFHSLALRSDGTLRAWGYNESGQLGNASTANSNVPVQVTTVAGVTQIASGALGHRSMAIALSPTINVTPVSMTFPDQLVGTNSATQTITVNNNGPASFSLSQAVLTGTHPGDFSVTFNSCTGNLVPSGGACNVMVRFAPTGRGARTAILRFYDNAFDSPQTVSLTGTGLAPEVGLSATSLTFAPVLVGSPSPVQTITVTNTGTAPLTVSSVTVSPFFFVSANSCSGSLAPGQTCNTSVFFNSTSRGDFVGNLNYFSSASGSPHPIALYGTALATTITTIASSANPVMEGTSITLTVNVSSGSGVPIGSVQLFDFASSVATVPLTGGVATYTLIPPVGAHSYTAAYQPLGFFVASTSAVLQQVITAPTPTGTNVSTSSTVETSTITPTFPSVTSAGQTTVAPIEPSSAGSVPGGYSISGSSLAFEISTTASLGGIDPNDPATWIVIRFDVPSITDPLAFANLRVLHNEGGLLVDRTILSGAQAPDFSTKTIYARVPSLSPFVLSQVTGTSIPQVTGPLNPLALGATATVVANFTDVASQTSHTCTFSWDDATTNTTVTAPTGASGSCSASHVYAQAGVYTVAVSVSNGSGGPANSKFEYVVVYDPNGGFVTGGGWINSPTGAYVATPSLIGKASFGFVSKYKQGATLPTGQTEFQFHVASFNFQSTVYEWLVIAGARAQYKGSGTVNGSGNFGFMLTAIDGQINGGGGVDKFRIKIWDKNNNDTIVYDNQISSTDNADLTTPGTLLGGGSIVIHK